MGAAPFSLAPISETMIARPPQAAGTSFSASRRRYSRQDTYGYAHSCIHINTRLRFMAHWNTISCLFRKLFLIFLSIFLLSIVFHGRCYRVEKRLWRCSLAHVKTHFISVTLFRHFSSSFFYAPHTEGAFLNTCFQRP